MVNKTIAVLGVTGNQGGAVASEFLKLGWKVRGITRSSTSAAAQTLREKGIDIVEADIDNKASLVKAFSGAHVIFAMTDFWAPFFEKHTELSKVSDRATGEYAMEIEIRRGKAIVDAAAQVLHVENAILERFILSTLPSFKEQSKGKYTYCYHFDGKSVISEYLKKQQKELWARSSLLIMGFYTTNMARYSFLRGASSGGKGDAGKSFKHTLRQTGSPEAKHPLVVPEDAGKFAALLVKSRPRIELLGVSEMESYSKFMSIWTEITGIKGEVEEVSVDTLYQEAGGPQGGGLAREAAESMATSAEFGWGESLVLPTDLDPEFKGTGVREYIESENWDTFFGRT